MALWRQKAGECVIVSNWFAYDSDGWKLDLRVARFERKCTLY